MLSLFLVSILIASVAPAATISTDLTSNLNFLVELNETPDGTIPEMPGGYAGTMEGFPLLPRFPMEVELRPGTEAVSVTSIETWETVTGSLFIPPLSKPLPLIIEQAVTTPEQNMNVYTSDSYWPSRPVELSGTGFTAGGVPAAELLVTPLRWNPVSMELQRLSSLEVSVQTVPTENRHLPTVDSGNCRRLLIVTDQSCKPAFQQLADRRNDQGIITEIVTMDTVYASATGRDNAEILRNFVKNYYSTKGLDFLLLGGDTNIVPFRYAYAMTCEANFASREDSLPCDLYFSDLDGTWDANGNDIFGEVTDNVDLYPDVFVGRAPVENTAEAEAFVNKIIACEDCTQQDYYQRVLFLAMVLWANPYTNSGDSKDYIDEEFLPNFLNITKLYEALGNENLTTTMAALNEGQNLINHDGHAWYSSIGVGGGDYLGISDADAINSNGRFASSMYSIGCWSAAFDYDAVAEHFVTNPNGGAVAYIGNSSYGWGSPGNPCYGYSDALDHIYHDYLYSDRTLTSGELLAATKEYFIPYSQWKNVYRWHQYDVNLLGDPSFRPYRKTPVDITVTCPALVTPNTSIFPVRVSGVPAQGLTVCVHDEGSNWAVEELNASGSFTFDFTAPVTGDVKVTVTGPNVKRTSIDVPRSTGPDPVISQLTILDNLGYGQLSPGCTADLQIKLLNQGTENLTDVELAISSVSGPAVVSQDSSLFGNINAGAESTGSPSLSLHVDSSAVNADLIALNGQIQTGQGNWDITIPLLVHAPGLYFTTYSINDSTSGNANGIPEPGETFDLIASIANVGMLNAQGVSAVMTGYPSSITWLSDSAYTDSIPPEGTEPFAFVCKLDTGTVSPSFPWLHFNILLDDYLFSDSLRLTIGETGISNDVESGVLGWTHSGTNDMWNISSNKSHSPVHSWFCGGTNGYVNGMDCSLFSPEIILAPNASLEFWTTFDTAIYGSDGMYVIGHDGTTADTLAYIGSGGALSHGDKGIGTGWVPYTFDLSSYETGITMQIEFRFKSDDDGNTGTGFYIDDISIEGAYTASTGISDHAHIEPVLGLPSPNPTSGVLTVPVNIPTSGNWNLAIYDISGRLLISREGQSPFEDEITIDASLLSSGIYLLKLSGSAEATARLVLLRD